MIVSYDMFPLIDSNSIFEVFNLSKEMKFLADLAQVSTHPVVVYPTSGSVCIATLLKLHCNFIEITLLQ